MSVEIAFVNSSVVTQATNEPAIWCHVRRTDVLVVEGTGVCNVRTQWTVELTARVACVLHHMFLHVGFECSGIITVVAIDSASHNTFRQILVFGINQIIDRWSGFIEFGRTVHRDVIIIGWWRRFFLDW